MRRARLRGADAERRHLLPPGIPRSLSDPDELLSAAVVATVLTHSRDWVRTRSHAITLGEKGAVRHEVSVEFELPGLAWAAVPRGQPVLVPLGLVDKERLGESEPRAEAGDPLEMLDHDETAEVMAAGAVAVAQGAGAPVDGELRRLVWRVVAGGPEDTNAALEKLRRGRSTAAARAWSHEPFRELVEILAHRLPVIVRLQEPERRRVLRYSYEESPGRRRPLRLRGLGDRAAHSLGWRGARVWCPLPELGDAAQYRFEVTPGLDLEAEAQVIGATPRGSAITARSAGGFQRKADLSMDGAPRGSRGVLSLSVRARRSDLLRGDALVASIAAVLLSAAWFALPMLGSSGRNAAALAVALPAVLAAYFGRPWGHPVLRHLLRGARSVTISVGLVSFAAAVALASGASTSALRLEVGVAALAGLAATALLLETRRRVTGTPVLSAPVLGRPGIASAVEAAVTVPVTTGVDAMRLSLLALVSAGGLLVVAVADDSARAGRSGAYELLWLGLLAIFVPALAFAMRVRSRREAMVAVVLAGVALYLVKVLHSPTYFTLHDEFSTLRTTVDIQRFGDLFHANPLIPVHPFYPALELATSALSRVTGLSIFASGLLLIGVLRVALMIGLFLLFESVSSTRVAAVATVVYAANPSFLFFDSQWAYESFALPLAIVALAMIARAGPETARPARWMPHRAWLALPIVITVTVAHPLTSLALVVFLAAWAGIDAWVAARTGRERRRDLAVLSAAGGGFLVFWVLVVAQRTGGYIGPVLKHAGHELVKLILGNAGPKRIFTAPGVPKTPAAEQVVAFASVAIALVVIALGVRLIWRRFEPLTAAIALAAIAYPLTLPLRLTEAGTEIANRASEFAYVGIAFLAALLVREGWRRLQKRGGRLPSLAAPVVLTAAAVLFMGGVVVGWGRYARLPGRYMVVADARSIDPIGRADARWAREQLGLQNRIATDRINGLLWGAIGLQAPQGGEILGRSVPHTITAPTLDAEAKYALVKDDLRFLVVDFRLATGLPALGFYFEPDEPGAFVHKRPPTPAALHKYDNICPVGRVLDSGPIVVYDTRRIAEQFDCDVGPGPPSSTTPHGPANGGAVGAPPPGGGRP